MKQVWAINFSPAVVRLASWALQLFMGQINGEEINEDSQDELESALYQSLEEFNESLAESEMPHTGENSDKLDAINFAGEVPEKYRGSLSLTIMTDPVFDPKLPKYMFERTWISTHLLTSSENPISRGPLDAKDLVANSTLKTEIDKFVAETCALDLAKPGKSAKP